MDVLHCALGACAMLGIAWVCSERRAAITWRPVLAGIALAWCLAAALRALPGVAELFARANGVLDAVQAATTAGTAMVFGYLGGATPPFAPSGAGSSFVLAAQALPLVLVVSALSALLFHLGVLGALVRGFAWLLERALGIALQAFPKAPGRIGRRERREPAGEQGAQAEQEQLAAEGGPAGVVERGPFFPRQPGSEKLDPEQGQPLDEATLLEGVGLAARRHDQVGAPEAPATGLEPRADDLRPRLLRAGAEVEVDGGGGHRPPRETPRPAGTSARRGA